MDLQISIDDLLRKEETPEKVEIPIARSESEKIYTIPEDVWAERCRICVHKNGAENIPIPIWAVHKQQYAAIIPCRIMAVSRPNDCQGECMSFTPRLDTYGICRTCIYTNQFHEGFCRKDNHSQEHQVFKGQDWGKEYYRRSLYVCDDYEPDQNVKDGRY